MFKKNDIIEADIISVSSEGSGIAKPGGYTVFVPSTAAGDRALIKILKADKNYGYGKVMELLSPSPYRTSVSCPSFGKCGGCNLLHISYEKQLEIKRQIVYDAITRIGGFKDITVHPTEGMEIPYNYRNKVQLPADLREDGVVFGFYAPKSHRVISAEGCLLQHPTTPMITKAVEGWILNNGITIYNEETGKGILRHIYTRTGFKSGEIMVSVITNSNHLPAEASLVSALRSLDLGEYKLKTIIHNINMKNTNVITGEKSRILYGNGYITDVLDGLKFEISHNSFYQVNPYMTERIYQKALSLSGDISGKTVFDLYCGIGTISLFMARSAKKVVGIEYVADAVRDAERNALINGISNAEFYEGDAGAVTEKLYREGVTADITVVDPPRKGCGENLLSTLVKMSPEKIIYISCNPATLARDMKYLSENGYKASEAFPFDQFPHTSHVECVTLMSRIEK